MEILPIEIVEMIVKQLIPQDLARCSAVCREWREIFNHDRMWKPHCDPELEEPLRTIPCVAKPAFVAPGVENSTLSPISHWKLAFMREKHLWKNWSSEDMKDKNENVIKSNYKSNVVNAVFLTDSLVVVWYSTRIEIFDVSVVPTAFVAKTDISVSGGHFKIRVTGSTMLLVEQMFSIQVFNVDISNETIELKHIIPLTRSRLSGAIVAEEHVYLSWDDEESKLKIFDLNTGKLLKEEPCPVKITQNVKVYSVSIKSSPTSDFVACRVVVEDDTDGKEYDKYYVYSLKQLAFLLGPVAEYENPYHDFTIQGHWLATTDYETLKVYNFQSRDVLLSHDRHKLTAYFPSEHYEIKTFNNCFVFVDEDCDSDSESGESCIKMYFPSHRSLSTVCKMYSVDAFKIINNKFITIFNGQSEVSKSVWKPSGQMVEKCDFSVRVGCKVNRSFTKVLNKEYLKGKLTLTINYLW